MAADYYRLYELDHSGRIVRVTELLCASDKAAFSEALAQLGARRVELWQGARKVASMQPRADAGDAKGA